MDTTKVFDAFKRQSAHRTFGMGNVDYQRRIDFPALIKQRTKRLQEHMKKHGFGALLLYDPSNIRYVTGTVIGQFVTAKRFLRYALVPENADPILFGLVGLELPTYDIFCPWLRGRMKPALVWHGAQTGVYKDPGLSLYTKRWAADLKETLMQEGLAKEKLGLDKTDLVMAKALTEAGINYADGTQAILEARAIKLKDELELLKISAAMSDAALCAGREAIKPGVTEKDIAAVMADVLEKRGVENMFHSSCQSGGNVNPWLLKTTDRLLRYGDLVKIEAVFHGPAGYCSDFCRVYHCGDVEPTEEQRQLYRTCYDALYGSIKVIRPGASTREIAETFLVGEEDKYETMGLSTFGHGIGIDLYDLPIISRAYSMKYPMEIKENMFISLETITSSPDGPDGVRLEENMIVTDTGVEIVSLAPHDPKLLQT